MKINPGNARGLLVPQGDRPFSFVVYSSEIRDFGYYVNNLFYFVNYLLVMKRRTVNLLWVAIN